MYSIKIEQIQSSKILQNKFKGKLQLIKNVHCMFEILPNKSNINKVTINPSNIYLYNLC